MIPPAFDYAAPASVDEAVALLEERGDDAKLLAGGHSLLPLMKLRLAAPELIVDLGKISNLAFIEDRGDHLAVGAMTTHRALETSGVVRSRVPLLAQAIHLVGDQQVRNRGTIGGSLAHADPAADLPAVVTALGARIVARRSAGEREIEAENFFQDIWTTLLDPTEVVTEVRFPYDSVGTAYAYEKFRQRAADWAIIGVAVNGRQQDGAIQNVAVVLTNVAPTPVHARATEDALRGGRVDQETVRAAAERASEGLEPSDELKASADYKRHLARVLTHRALEAAFHLH
jgi:carbon-monoxide dehydrogenase medium subunit